MQSIVKAHDTFEKSMACYNRFMDLAREVLQGGRRWAVMDKWDAKTKCLRKYDLRFERQTVA